MCLWSYSMHKSCKSQYQSNPPWQKQLLWYIGQEAPLLIGSEKLPLGSHGRKNLHEVCEKFKAKICKRDMTETQTFGKHLLRWFCRNGEWVKSLHSAVTLECFLLLKSRIRKSLLGNFWGDYFKFPRLTSVQSQALSENWHITTHIVSMRRPEIYIKCSNNRLNTKLATHILNTLIFF